MRKIFFTFEVGFAGMTDYVVEEYDDDVTDEILNQEAWLGAKQHAESYGYYPEEEYDDLDDLDEEERNCYLHSIEGRWEEYDPKEHDRYL